MSTKSPAPAIAVDGEAAETELEQIGKILHDAVEDYEEAAEGDEGTTPSGARRLASSKSTGSSTSLNYGADSVASTLPATMKQALKEAQRDASIRVAFGDRLLGAFKMVYLGTCEVDNTALLKCETPVELERLVSSLLHKVLLSGTIARKITLIATGAHVGVRAPNSRLTVSPLSLLLTHSRTRTPLSTHSLNHLLDHSPTHRILIVPCFFASPSLARIVCCSDNVKIHCPLHALFFCRSSPYS